jgi:hypothetical protein
MENIPNEILQQILSYLPNDQRGLTRQVSKLWKDVTEDLPTQFNDEEKSLMMFETLMLGSRLVFARDLIDTIFDDKNIEIHLLDDQDKKIISYHFNYDLDLDEEDSYEPDLMILDKKYKDHEEKLKQNLKIPDDSMTFSLLRLIIYMMMKFPSDFTIQVNQRKIKIKQLKKQIRLAIVNWFHQRKSLDKILFPKDKPIEEILNESILSSYLEELLDHTERIKEIVPNYILRDPEVFKKLLKTIF